MTISRILSSLGVFGPQIKEKPKIQEDEKSDQIAKIWHLLDGSKLRLICNHDTIECEVITGKKSSKASFRFPEDFTPNQGIDRLKNMQPILLDDHIVDFRERITFQENFIFSTFSLWSNPEFASYVDASYFFFIQQQSQALFLVFNQ